MASFRPPYGPVSRLVKILERRAGQQFGRLGPVANKDTKLLIYGFSKGPSFSCASSKLLRPRNQGLTLRLNSEQKMAKLRRYARRCCLPRLTWRPCHSGDVSAPRRPGVGERRFAAASDGAEERVPTLTARGHGTGFLGCPSRFVARVGEPPAHRPRGHRGPLASRPIPTVLGKYLAAPPPRSASD